MRTLRLSIAMLAVAVCASGCAVGLYPRAADVTPTEAQLFGEGFTNTGGDVDGWFEYGKTPAYGTSTRHVNVGLAKDATESWTLPVRDLDFGSVYHFRFCAQDTQEGTGPGCSQDRTFTTQGRNDESFVYGTSYFGGGSVETTFGSGFKLTGTYRFLWTAFVYGPEAQRFVRVERQPSGCNAPASICEGRFQGEWDGKATAPVTCLSVDGHRAVIGTGSFTGGFTHPPQLLTVVDENPTDRFRPDAVSTPPTACPPPPADVSGIPATEPAINIDAYLVHEASGPTAATR